MACRRRNSGRRWRRKRSRSPRVALLLSAETCGVKMSVDLVPTWIKWMEKLPGGNVIRVTVSKE